MSLKKTPLRSTSKLTSSGFGLNRTKLNAGESKLNSNTKLKNKKKINAKSKKQTETDRDYRLVTDRMRQENAQICTGCEKVYGDSLTHSHLIPRSRREDLIAEYKNITYHCIECHPIWESVDRVQLLDYERNMQIVKELDPEYYEILLMKQSMYNENKNDDKCSS